MSTNTEFDIIVFGASGYTGRLVAEHLAQRHGQDGGLKWAMAGRSEAELAAVRGEIDVSGDTPLVVADALDPASLRAMVGRTKAVITTVGPYQRYGSDLVAACAQSGTDYFDLSGESNWMRRMIDTHDAQAAASGARILFACGFDSIPSELGVWFCQETAREILGAPVPRVKARVRAFRGGVSGGSVASGQATREALAQDPALAAVIDSPFGLTPGFEGPPQPSGTEPQYDPDVGDVVPFMLGTVDAQNVHRSNMLMGYPYGRDFVYDEMLLADASKATTPPNINASGLKPGEGPAKEDRQSGLFDILFIGIAPDGRQVRVSVSGREDPGYGATPRMIAESAIGILQAPDVAGGIWTPAAALQGRLLDRLRRHAGLMFGVEG